MRLDSRAPDKPSGIIVDTGTNKRVPFVVWCDFDTGEYEAILATPDGLNYQVDENYRCQYYKGVAVGKLKLVPLDEAHTFGLEPQKVVQQVTTITPDQKLDGLEKYKRTYFEVWNGMRGESKRCTQERFTKYVDQLKDLSFLDQMVLKSRPVPMTIHT